MIDLVGQKFGEWTVLAFSHKIKKKYGKYYVVHRFWVCRCSCGTMRIIPELRLRYSNSRQCRVCYHKSRKIPLTELRKVVGDVYNKWTILDFSHISNEGKAMYMCQCECGNKKKITLNNLNTGTSKQCKECFQKYGSYLR